MHQKPEYEPVVLDIEDVLEDLRSGKYVPSTLMEDMVRIQPMDTTSASIFAIRHVRAPWYKRLWWKLVINPYRSLKYRMRIR